MKILSIDPGTRNCGYAVWENGKLTYGTQDLFTLVSRDKRTDYPYMAYEFTKSPMFDNIDILLIENQIQARMKMLACAWRCFYWEISVPVSPLAVRKYFKISNSNYKKNKADSVRLVQSLLPTGIRKKDDIADAIIQLMWYLKKNKL